MSQDPRREVIVVPVDGATNCKLEVVCATSGETLASTSTATPRREVDGRRYDDLGREWAWFDAAIADLIDPAHDRVLAIAPVTRGASGGLINAEGRLSEVPGADLCLSYEQRYPEEVNQRFATLAGDADSFFAETGSVRDAPGSLTLLKRLVYEESCRPEVLARSVAFGTLGALTAGHFLGDLGRAVATCGNEHGYWMCHSGARAVHAEPGTPSSLARRLPLFARLVPATPSCAYQAIGRADATLCQGWGLDQAPLVLPGGHDTCLSHLPVMAACAAALPDSDQGVIHVDGGTWTMIAWIGSGGSLDGQGWRHDQVVQGTVDGHPVITARYGGGNDFKALAEAMQQRGRAFDPSGDEALLATCCAEAACFVQPNVHPVCRGTGPFPDCQGTIIGEEAFHADPRRAVIYANLAAAAAIAAQITAVAGRAPAPVVLTAGASRNALLGTMIATLSQRRVYVLRDANGDIVSETTTHGAACCARAALDGCHPHAAPLAAATWRLHPAPAASPDTARLLTRYHQRWLELAAGSP